jgi:hypothetical protein
LGAPESLQELSPLTRDIGMKRALGRHTCHATLSLVFERSNIRPKYDSIRVLFTFISSYKKKNPKRRA